MCNVVVSEVRKFGFGVGFETRMEAQHDLEYPDVVSYEILDSKMYIDIGGGHMHVIGIERNQPEFPGYRLELPAELVADSDKPVIMRPGNRLSRFNGPVYYALMLDTCNDIYEEAFAVFNDFLTDQIIIE